MSNFGSHVHHHANVCKIKERLILKGFLKDSQMLLWNPELKNLLRSWCRNDFTFCSWVGGLFK